MRLTLLRHATLLLDIGGHRLMVDPMLDPPGARGPVRGPPQERPNPLVPLPVSIDEAVAGVEAVLLSHTHVDHLDAQGVSALPPYLPWFFQPEDGGDLTPIGLTDVRPVPMGATVEWEGLRIVRTGGRHGREEAAVQGLGPVSGFVVAADDAPPVYVVGDTVWCPEVEAALADHSPDVVVVNAGRARFLHGAAGRTGRRGGPGRPRRDPGRRGGRRVLRLTVVRERSDFWKDWRPCHASAPD